MFHVVPNLLVTKKIIYSLIFNGSNFFLEIIASIVIPTPMIENMMYGVSFPNDCVIGPPMVGPTAHPNPKIVSYAPMIFPDMPFFVLLKIISKVNGKNILIQIPLKLEQFQT